MFNKRATYNIIETEPLNTPILHNYIKDQDIIVNRETVNKTIQKIAETSKKSSETKDGDGTDSSLHFDLEAEIKEHPDSLFIRCFAIKADETNDNGDYFSRDELIKATPTFVGVPLFTNHANSDINEARGKVVHSWWDNDKNGIMIVGRVDAVAYPQLARGIREKYVLGTSMGCFTPECRVLMADGTYLPISEVQSGDFVYTHKGRTQEVINSQIRYKKEFIKQVSFEGYSSILEVTKNHPILTLKTQEKCACGCEENLPEYKEGSHRSNNWKTKYHKRFISGHSQKIWNSNPKAKNHNQVSKKEMQSPKSFNDKDLIWKNSQDLVEGDVVLIPCPVKEKKTKDCSIAKARLIGYFAAEGCFSRRKGELYSVTFSFGLHEKDTYVKEVCELMKQAFRDSKPCIIPRKKGNVCLVVVRNPRIAKWFYKYCGEYSHKKKFHRDVLNWPNEYTRHVLGAYINGDGCFSTRRPDPRNGSLIQSSEMATVSRDLASQLHLMFTKIGVYSKCYAQTGNNFGEIKQVVNGERTSVQRQFMGKQVGFNVLPTHWISISGSFVSKLQKYTDCPGLLHKRNTNNLRFVNIENVYTNLLDSENAEKNVYTNYNSYLVRKIKSITNSFYDGPVYNLQVKKDNSYVVEDVAVKNCQVQYSLCSICHNYAETPDDYCTHIREQKTREVHSNKIECKYHTNGNENKCPVCECEKGQKKTFASSGKAFEFNYGIKFIENSFVVNPACSTCGVTEVIDPQKFLDKVAEIEKILPKLLKAASSPEAAICTDTQCVKIAGQKELDSLNQALDLLSSVSQVMLSQKEQIDLEFLSDLVTVLADLQTVVDELTEQGYGRLPSPDGTQPENAFNESPIAVAPPEAEIMRSVQPVNPTPGGGSKIHSGPAGQVGSVTSPVASTNILRLKKLSYNNIKKHKTINIPGLNINNKDTSTQIKSSIKRLKLSFKALKKSL